MWDICSEHDVNTEALRTPRADRVVTKCLSLGVSKMFSVKHV